MIKKLVLSLFKFKIDVCYLRASALTFYSLFSLVPFVALIMIVAQALGVEDNLEHILLSQMSGQTTTVKYLLQFASNLIYESRNSTVAGFGIVITMASIYKVFSHIENNFNAIWQENENTNIARTTTIFITTTIVAPIIVLITSAANVFIIGFMKTSIHYLGADNAFLISTITNATSILILFALFSWIYFVIPNIKVSQKAAMCAGLVTAILHQLLQKIVISTQIYLLDQSIVFGSFSAIPILMLWMQLTWMIIMYGATLSYIIHFKVNSSRDLSFDKQSLQDKIGEITEIVNCLINIQLSHQTAPDIYEISERTQIPPSLIHQAIRRLQRADIIMEVKLMKDKNLRYTLANTFQVEADIKNLLLNNQKLML